MISVNINVNDTVKVRLKPTGFKMHAARHQEIFKDYPQKPAYHPPRVDPGGWSEFQLHELMQLFGSAMSVANPELPFETELRIDLA